MTGLSVKNEGKSRRENFSFLFPVKEIVEGKIFPYPEIIGRKRFLSLTEKVEHFREFHS